MAWSPDISASAVHRFDAIRARAEEMLGGTCTLIAAAPRLHQGWELDEWIWLVEADGQFVALTTDHGGLCRIEASDIQRDVDRYLAASEAAQRLLAQLC